MSDLFATSVDYDSKSEERKRFFRIVQNKMHYAVNEQTFTEIIYNRANTELPFMGMKTFKGEFPREQDYLEKLKQTQKKLKGKDLDQE